MNDFSDITSTKWESGTKNINMSNVARTLRFEGNVPIKFWGEYVLTARCLINQTPSTILNGKTPYEMLHGKQHVYEDQRIFGSLCYSLIDEGIAIN